MLGVNNNHVVMMKREGKSQRGHNKKKKDVKVTYISSPMKVKTSASNFRALVQELTGQASNVAEMFVEADHYNYYYDGVHDDANQKGTNDIVQQLSSSTSETYFHDSTWFKSHDDHFSHLHSTSFMEPLNGHLQWELLSFDMI